MESTKNLEFGSGGVHTRRTQHESTRVSGGQAGWHERNASFVDGPEDCNESTPQARLELWSYEEPVASWEWEGLSQG